MSEPNHVQSQLLKFLREEIFSPQLALSEETDLISNGFDSISLASLLLFIEKTYGFWVPEGEITESTFKNTRTLSETVVRLLHER